MESLPLSLVNDYLFCPRRAGLKLLDGARGTNEHTVKGDVVHERVDTPGYHTQRGVTILRALPVWSERLGLNGICDIVEKHSGGVYVPVEFKKGPRRKFENDDVQVCAQAICLEEALGVSIDRGAIFFAASKHRREIELTAELRELTERTVAALHELVNSGVMPLAVRKPVCDKCSLYEICMPEATRGNRRSASEWFQGMLTNES